MKNQAQLNLHQLEFALLKNLAKVWDGKSEKLCLIVLVSGGHDSMTLLEALVATAAAAHGELKPKWKHFCNSDNPPTLGLTVLHCNHKTRGAENEIEQGFVTDTCLRLGVACKVSLRSEWDTRENFQSQARAWRYSEANALAKSLEQNSAKPCASWICTAHHGRDIVETVLLNLIRGTGPQGLKCLPMIDAPARKWRPFVETSIDDLTDYSSAKGVHWKVDSSNDSLDYSRNLLRHKVLPVFAELNPQYEKAFLAMQKNLRLM